MEYALYSIAGIVFLFFANKISEFKEKEKVATEKIEKNKLVKAVREAGGQLRKRYVEVRYVGYTSYVYELKKSDDEFLLLTEILNKRSEPLGVVYFERLFFLAEDNEVVVSEKLKRRSLHHAPMSF